MKEIPILFTADSGTIGGYTNKHVVYRSQLEAMNDQIWTDILTSGTAYAVYCWIGYIVAALIIIWIIKCVIDSIRFSSRNKNKFNGGW